MERRCRSIAGAGGPQSEEGASALERVGWSAANEEVLSANSYSPSLWGLTPCLFRSCRARRDKTEMIGVRLPSLIRGAGGSRGVSQGQTAGLNGVESILLDSPSTVFYILQEKKKAALAILLYYH